MAQIQYTFKKNDEYYTPSYAVLPLISYLKEGATVWCPFDTEESEYVKVFTAHGFNVLHTHICNGEDFFSIEVPKCDYIISNPPYSLKTQVFKRLFDIGKPFAMLVNLQGLFDHRERFELFKSNPVELMYLSPRVNYYTTDNKQKTSGVPFQSGYVCSRLLPQSLTFKYLSK